MPMHTSGIVDQLLTSLRAAIHAALPANLAGFYLRGSLASGDFRAESSDIDLLAVTERRVNETEFARLLELHTEFARRDHPFARRIEIAYIDRTALRRYQPGQRFPTLGQGETLTWSEHQSNWLLERWMVRVYGIALFGPLPVTLIDPIDPAQIRAAVAARLQDWAAWASDIDDPEWQLPRRHKAYIVETMSRALYTLATGEIASKAHSVAWACHTLPAPWRALVEQSQSWRTDDSQDETLIQPVRAFVLWAATSAPSPAAS